MSRLGEVVITSEPCLSFSVGKAVIGRSPTVVFTISLFLIVSSFGTHVANAFDQTHLHLFALFLNLKACQFIQTNCTVQKFIRGERLRRTVKWDGTLALSSSSSISWMRYHPSICSNLVVCGKLKGVVEWSQVNYWWDHWPLTPLALWINKMCSA